MQIISTVVLRLRYAALEKLHPCPHHSTYNVKIQRFDARTFRTPLSMQSWYSLITDILHLFSRRSNYPRCSVLDAGFEYTDDKAAQLRSAYERQEKCVLFSKLPGELRNNIYKLLLVSDENITPERQLLGASNSFKQEFRDGKPITGLDVTLLRTCRAIYREALPLLYEKNVFKVDKCLSSWNFEDTKPAWVEEGACIFVL